MLIERRAKVRFMQHCPWSTLSRNCRRKAVVDYNADMTSEHLPQNDAAPSDGQSHVYRPCPPPSPEEQRLNWAAWHQAMELSHAMLMAGLRHRIGPQGDLQAAYRQWYEQYQANKWDKDRAS
jgi:hypothetical protein